MVDVVDGHEKAGSLSSTEKLFGFWLKHLLSSWLAL